MNTGATPEDTVAATVAAVNSGNVPKLVSLYEPDCQLILHEPQGKVLGFQELQGWFRGIIASGSPVMSATVSRVIHADGLALVTLDWSMELDVDEERTKSGQLHGIAVLRRRPDGSYGYVFDISMVG